VGRIHPLKQLVADLSVDRSILRETLLNNGEPGAASHRAEGPEASAGREAEKLRILDQRPAVGTLVAHDQRAHLVEEQLFGNAAEGGRRPPDLHEQREILAGSGNDRARVSRSGSG